MVRVLVLGGNGFVGKALCREAVRKGWQVSSLSRSGAPAEAAQDPDLQQVDWQVGSALDPETYKRIFAEKPVDYLVHSIGILVQTSSNPDASFKAVIRDTTEVALKSVSDCKVDLKGFGYVSATTFGYLSSILLPAYTAMKKEAEQLILESPGTFKKVIARPGFIYGWERMASYPAAWFTGLATLFTAGLFPRPIHVEYVAKGLLNELSSEKPANPILEISDLLAKSTP